MEAADSIRKRDDASVRSNGGRTLSIAAALDLLERQQVGDDLLIAECWIKANNVGGEKVVGGRLSKPRLSYSLYADVMDEAM
ncbi:hypothetical protein NKI34_01115 [Mesorhizobium sp. M0700]